jgi:hypothetical protein
MWKREIPAMDETSSRVNASARWVSINQSAFWAGFMDDDPHSKRPDYDLFARASFDSPCSCSKLESLLCPGRDAGLFALLRRTATVPTTGVRYGPGSAAHHAAKSGALRCVRGTESTLFRFAENSSEGIAGNTTPTVHTAPAFNPTAQEAARQNTA